MTKYKVDMSDYPKWFDYNIPPRAKDLPIPPEKFHTKEIIIERFDEYEEITKEELVSLNFDYLSTKVENDYSDDGDFCSYTCCISAVKLQKYENKNYEKQLNIFNKKVKSITKYNNTIEKRFNKWKSLKDKYDNELKTFKKLTKIGKKNVKAI